MAGRDGFVRVMKLRAGKNYLTRAVQHLYSLELSRDRIVEAPKAALDAETPAFRPKRDAEIAARVRMQDLA